MNDLEEEANEFAMELLMPTQFVRDYYEKHGPFDLVDCDGMKRMAKAFGVNVELMVFRLGQISSRPR